MKHSEQEKYNAIDKALGDEYVLLHMDTSSEMLVIPGHLKAKSSVTLKVSRWFRGTMELFEDHLDADLLFDGKYFSCSIPLSAIWGITSANGQHSVWPDSAPQDVLISLLNPQLYAKAKERQGAKEEKEPEEAKTASSLPKKGHLRRVK